MVFKYQHIQRQIPFPITFNVSGVVLPITRIEVRISGYTHGDVSDVGMILRAPTGPDTDSAVLLGRYDGTPISANNTNVTLTNYSSPEWDGTSSGTYGSNPIRLQVNAIHNK